MKRALKLLGAVLMMALPLSAEAQTTGTTFSNSATSSQWTAYGRATHVDVQIGDAGGTAIMTGNLGNCSLKLPYTCNATSGAGTAEDPYICSTVPIVTNCSGGTPLLIAAGGKNFDTRVDNLVPAVAPVLVNAAPVPLSPLVPAGSAFGAMLVVLWMRRRANAG